MSQRARFFDSSGGDRIYTSDAWAQVVEAIMGDGVAKGRGDELSVGESSPQGMSVDVETGSMFIQGRLFEVHSGAETLAIDSSDPTNPRIDRVVVRLDPTARTAELDVLTGTPAGSPSAPSLTQTPGGTWEIALAQVAVAALAGGIVNANVTDERSFASGSATDKVLDTSTGHDHDGSDSKGVAHSATTGKTADDHHAQSHTHGSAGDGTALSPATLTAAKLIGSVCSPSVTANQNNYNPSGFSTCTILRLVPTADRNITGFAAQEHGRIIFVYNAATGPSQSINLKTESTSSTAANRITMEQDLVGTLTISPRSGAYMVYDGTLQRWLLTGYNIFNAVP